MERAVKVSERQTSDSGVCYSLKKITRSDKRNEMKFVIVEETFDEFATHNTLRYRCVCHSEA